MRVFGRAAVGSRCGGQGRAGPGVGCGVLDRFAALICPPGYRWVQAGKGSAQAGLATREPARTLGGSKVPVHGRTPPSPWHANCIPWVYPSPYTTGSGPTGSPATTCGGTPGTSIAGGGPQAPTLASTSSPRTPKHGQSMDKCRQGTQGGHTPLTGTNRHVRGLGASVVKRRQGLVQRVNATRPHFRPQATTPHPNTHGFLNYHNHLHPSAPLPGKRRAPLNSLYY